MDFAASKYNSDDRYPAKSSAPMMVKIISGSSAYGSLKPALDARLSHNDLLDSVGPFVVAADIPSLRCVRHLCPSAMAFIATDAEPLVYGLGSPPLDTGDGSKWEASL